MYSHGVVEMEEREESYQCLWVGNMEGLVWWWTWTMKVLLFSFSEVEQVTVAINKKGRMTKEPNGAIEQGSSFSLAVQDSSARLHKLFSMFSLISHTKYKTNTSLLFPK